MKYLDGQEVLKGDAVIVATDGDTVAVGQVHQFMERTGHVRISGYPLPVKSDICVLAKDAYKAYTVPILEKQKAEHEVKLAEEQAAAEATGKI